MIMAFDGGDEASYSIDDYWNPGEETHRERLKLKTLHNVSEAAGILRHVFGRLAKSSIGILTYHRICDATRGVAFPTINVTPEQFRRQLTGLQSAGFGFASLTDVIRHCSTKHELPERTVIVTFDDIYDNVFQNAWPVLQELKIPATLFVSTAFINSQSPFLFDPWARHNFETIPTASWLPATSHHLHEMNSSPLIEIGAHTHSHQDFRNRPADFKEDLLHGLSLLEDQYDVAACRPFAFPYGSPRLGFCNDSLMAAIKDSPLQCGLTTGSHTNSLSSSPFGWGRFHVFQHDTPRSLAAKLDGWYEWLPRIKNKLVGHVNQSSEGSQ